MSVFRGSNTPDTDWTVPVQRTPYPARQPETDERTERLYVPDDGVDLDDPVRSPDDVGSSVWRARTVVVALLVAFLALVAAAAASVIAWQAMDRADRATARSASHAGPGSARAVSRLPVPVAPATVAVPAGPGLVYAQEPVGLSLDCGASGYLDVDGNRPRTDGDHGDGDVRFDNRCGRDGVLMTAGPGARQASHVTDGYLDRDGCADAVQTDRLQDGDSVLVVKGTALCVVTDAAIALVEVTGTEHSTVNLRVTAWTVQPDAATPSGRTGRGG